MANINWKFPLSKGRLGFFEFNETVEDAIKQNIQMVLFTRKGSRVIYKDYGTDLHKYQFEPQTTELKGKIRVECVNAITKWVKGVSVTDVQVLFKDEITPFTPYFNNIVLDEHAVLIVIYYEIVSADGLFKKPNQSIALLLQS